MGCTCLELHELRGYKIKDKNEDKFSNSEIYKVSKEEGDLTNFYTMKRMRCENPEEIERIKNDIKLLENFEHYNIVQYIESFGNDKVKYIIMELCESDLKKFIDDKKKNNKLIDEKVIYLILKDICYGLKEMHSKDIIHGDLKSENILIGSDGNIKISDFGISKYKNQSNNNSVNQNSESKMMMKKKI